jgi:hypothetical protein
VTFCSGNPPDDSALPMPWPYPQPDGWSVEWDPSPPTQIPPSDIIPGLAWYPYQRHVHWPCFKLRCQDLRLKTVCNNFHQLGTDVTFTFPCNIPACGIKCDGNCISGLVFVRGTLFDPTVGGLSGRYPTGQGIIPFEVRWSPQKWTRVLEPM